MDCIDLCVDPKSKLLKMTRPVYGGKANAVYMIEKDQPQIASIRVKSQEPAIRDSSRQGEVIKYPITISPESIKVKIVDVVKEEVEGVKLEDATIVIAGGRGIGSALSQRTIPGHYGYPTPLGLLKDFPLPGKPGNSFCGFALYFWP